MESARGDEVPELLEGFPDPVVGYEPSPDGRIVRWANPEAQEFFKSRADVGRPLADILELVDGALTEGPVAHPEGQFTITGDGDERERTVLFRWVGVDGGPPDKGGYLVLTDLTDHVGDSEYGDEERAETGGDGKTAEQGEPAGDPASPTMEEIVSVLSHDLRNPLEVAEIRLEAARETGEDVHFEKVELALDRIEWLIRDVRMLVRGRTIVDSTGPVALDELARDAWSTVQTDDATLELDAAARIEADEARLRQVLENAFRNSVEHAGPDVTVRVDLLADDAGFAIVDDGPGIAASRRAEVFEPGVSSRDGGTGIGLTIIQRIAEAHGWDVALGTAEGGGTRLEFTDVTIHA